LINTKGFLNGNNEPVSLWNLELLNMDMLLFLMSFDNAQLQNNKIAMTLDEFKYIFYWEWGHRMMGRVVGLAFILPWGYYAWVKNMVPMGYSKNLGLLLTMGTTQGMVGWWMVKSGLGEERRGDRREIRVSPYRLAAHLTMAFSTLGVLLWTALGIAQHPNDIVHTPTGVNTFAPPQLSKLHELTRSLSKSALDSAKRVRALAMGLTSITALTMITGAFVAGNDAGNAYNTFPKMDNQWIPIGDMIDPKLKPDYRNIFENTATVQWNHRLLGSTTAITALALTGLGLVHPTTRSALTPQAKRGLLLLGGAAAGQATLGIATLLSYVPIGLAAAHQLGSLVVFSSSLYVVHSLRYVSPKVISASAILKFRPLTICSLKGSQ
jgi:cytochrome c oxidase assembly protein subunit 15